MTHETKAGLVVSGSFLCLVSVVVFAKLKESRHPAEADQYAKADGTVQAPRLLPRWRARERLGAAAPAAASGATPGPGMESLPPAIIRAAATGDPVSAPPGGGDRVALPPTPPAPAGPTTPIAPREVGSSSRDAGRPGSGQTDATSCAATCCRPGNVPWPWGRRVITGSPWPARTAPTDMASVVPGSAAAAAAAPATGPASPSTPAAAPLPAVPDPGSASLPPAPRDPGTAASAPGTPASPPASPAAHGPGDAPPPFGGPPAPVSPPAIGNAAAAPAASDPLAAPTGPASPAAGTVVPPPPSSAALAATTPTPAPAPAAPSVSLQRPESGLAPNTAEPRGIGHRGEARTEASGRPDSSGSPVPPPSFVAQGPAATPPMPPLGTPASAASPAVPVPVPPSGAPVSVNPQVDSYDEFMYRCKPEDTFEKISTQYYLSDRYARALLLFNRNHPRAEDAVRQEPPVLQVGTPVFIPPLRILEKQYGNAIPGPSPLPAATSAPLPPPAQASAPLPAPVSPPSPPVGLSSPSAPAAAPLTGAQRRPPRRIP